MNHVQASSGTVGRRYRSFRRWVVFCCCPFAAASLALALPVPGGEQKPDEHLVGYWKFDEASGTTAADSSPHGRAGKLLGGATFDEHSVAGRVGKALRFDGRDAAVRIEGYKGVTGTTPRTICAWIKTGESKGELVSWGKEDFGQMWLFQFIRGHVGVTPRGGYYYMADTVHDDKWHHVAVVVREAELPNLHDDVTLYLDGEIAEIHRIGVLDLWPIRTGAELDVTIGRRFKGAIDELRIYDRALTDEEIVALCEVKSGT